MPSVQPRNAAVLERPAAAPAAPPRTAAAAVVREQPQPQKRGAGGPDYDLAVIGAGPGGYVCAIRGAQLGLKVALIEKDHLGGTCLNVGCIPTKAMLSSVQALETARNGKEFGFTALDVQPDYPAMVKRRDRVVQGFRGGIASLMKQNGIDVLHGLGRFARPGVLEVVSDAGPKRVTAGNVIVATGSVCARPPIPGIELDGVVNSDQLLDAPQVPTSLAVIGAGAVGLEWGDIFLSLGSRVTVIEMVDRSLPPADEEISQELTRSLKKKGMSFHLGVSVKSIERKNGVLSVRCAGADGAVVTVDAEMVLVATGRWPVTDGLGLDRIGVSLERRWIPVDDRMQTRAAGVYAIGDATPGPALAHTASKGGEVAAEVIAGHRARMDYRHIPSCVYTSPEVAWVGLSESEARERHGEVRVGRFPFRALGRAVASGHRDGFIKVVAEPRYGEILGVHMIGAHVTDLISEAVLGMSMEATVDEIIHAVHAHPTLPEAFHEATLDAWDRAIHKG